MTLTVQTASSKEQEKTKAALDKYLSGALKHISQESRNGVSAKHAVKDYLRDYNTKPLNSDFATAAIQEKEDSLKSEKGKFSFKEKKEVFVENNAVLLFSSFFPVVTASAAGAIALALPGGEGAVAAAVTGVCAINGVVAAKLFNAKLTEKEKANVSDYKDLKHMQLALKQLKKTLQAPKKEADKAMINKAFAMGIGNPGGVITSFAVAKQKSGR